jgi:lipopolysaccharide/colanic/teichoic acid biosynthesis glycosyltransferase
MSMTLSPARRAFDVAGALAGLAVFAPVMAAIAAAVLIDDGGPVLFRQERLGYRRRPFQILKFRTMRGGRITRAGRLLRATGLDEVPQLVNVLRGDMSAAGPRPITADDVARFGWGGAEYDFRWSCRPGLTGLAQLLGARADCEALALDRVHTEAWNVWLDCRLIAWSFAVNAFGKARTRQWLRGRFPAGAASPDRRRGAQVGNGKDACVDRTTGTVREELFSYTRLRR